MLGLHLDVQDNEFSRAVDLGFECFQFMPGGQLSYSPKNVEEKLRIAYDSKVTPVIHAPLCCYAVSDNVRTVNLSKIYLKELDLAVARTSYRRVLVVLHTGTCEDKSSAFARIANFCWWVINNTKHIVLCLENDVGSKKGTRAGYVSLLVSVCAEFESDRVKICLDTNHAWGNEIDNVLLDKDWNETLDRYVGVIHLNGIPAECVRGGHRDRHSSTPIEESVEGKATQLKRIYERHKGIPCIFERDTLEIAEKDLMFMRGA